MKKIKGSTISETSALLFVMLFLYTGVCKIWDHTIFKEQISASPLLAGTAPIIASSLPWIELLVVILLILPKWRLRGLYSSLALMIAFTLYIAGILLFDKNIPCSCGGAIEQLTWSEHIIFNIFFIALAILGIMGEKGRIKEAKRNLSLIGQSAI